MRKSVGIKKKGNVYLLGAILQGTQVATRSTACAQGGILSTRSTACLQGTELVSKEQSLSTRRDLVYKEHSLSTRSTVYLQGAQLVYKEGAHLTCGVTGFTNADPREPSVSPIEGQRATEGDV